MDNTRLKFRNYIFFPLILLLVGCLTQQKLIERRITERQEFFDSLSPDAQMRLRRGELSTGDSPQAVWIVYGNPDHKFTKTTGSSTNELWSYSSYVYDHFANPRPFAHPICRERGRSTWYSANRWTSSPSYNIYEYLKIEFENDKIKSYEELKR